MQEDAPYQEVIWEFFWVNFLVLANYVQIFSSSDDYFSPSIPVGSLDDKLRKSFSKLYAKKIIIGKCCLIGSLSVFLSGTNMGDYSSIGALTIVDKKINKSFFFNQELNIYLKKETLNYLKSYTKI